MDLIVTDLSGNTEMLTDFQKLQRTRKVNDEHSISFILFKTDRNQYAFDLINEESTLEYDSKSYVIKKITENTIGQVPVKQVTALRDYFGLIDDFQYDTISGSTSITQALNHALSVSNYTFTLIDTEFSNVEYESFGNDNSLSLLNKILTDYQAEIEVVGTVINVYGQIGNNSDFQFRFNHNVKTIEKSIDTSNLSTYIKGYGKQNDDGTYVCTADYTSPNSSIYGIRHAPPIQDDRFTDVNSLTDYLKKSLQDEPDISFTLTFAELKKAGYPWEVIGEGDTVFIIHEPLGIDITARVMEYVDFPESNDEPQVTLANFKNNLTDIVTGLGQTEKTVKSVLNDSGKVKFDALDEAVKIATQALNNSMTELEYPTNGGIIARDKTNPNNYLILNSAGLGLTTDGGKTYNYAITANGINADLITVGTLLANMIKGGTLTLGGADNGNGVVMILDANGESVAYFDAAIGGFDKLSVGYLTSPSIYNANYDDLSIDVTSNISAALESIPPLNNGNTVINFMNDISENIDVSNYLGDGTIEINLNGHKLNGNVYVHGCSPQYVHIHDGTVNGNGTSSSDAVVEIDRCTYVRLDNVKIYGNNSPNYGVYAHAGSGAYLANCEIYNVQETISSATSAKVTVDTCKGLGTDRGLHAFYGGYIATFGSQPGGSTSAVLASSGEVYPTGGTTVDTGTATPPAPPETTTRWKATSANNWSTSGYWSNDGVKQGNWGYGRRSGYWFFGTPPSSAVTGKTIKSMRVYVTRASSGGYSSDLGIVIRSHNYTSQPSGAPSPLSESSYSTTVNLAWGQSAWVSLPSSFFADFQNGTAKGIGVYVSSDSKSDYATMSSSATLEITYS